MTNLKEVKTKLEQLSNLDDDIWESRPELGEWQAYAECAKEALQELNVFIKNGEWKSIRKPPCPSRDGYLLLGYYPSNTNNICRLAKVINGTWYTYILTQAIEWKPTHWMNLPQLPKD